MAFALELLSNLENSENRLFFLNINIKGLLNRIVTERFVITFVLMSLVLF